jgi:hypothetical protein
MKEVNIPADVREKLISEGRLRTQELILVSDSGDVFFAWDVPRDERRVLEGVTTEMLTEGRRILKG